MKIINKFLACFILLTFLSCEKELTKINENPNGVIPQTVNPNLILPTVLSETAKSFVNVGYQDIAGVVQHTQKDAWSSGHNDYDWGGDQSWGGYYDILRNNQLLYDRSVELKQEFNQGVSLVIKSLMFGLITDLWGDAPYTYALKGELGGVENILPAFDSQEVIYKGILVDLEKANVLLSKNKSDYLGIVDASDIYYNGDPSKWRKLANSLQLRYYMRISSKLPAFAKSGIENIAGKPDQYPIIMNFSDDAAMSFLGNNEGDSWPANTYTDASGSNYRRIKMSATFVKELQSLNDPRLAVWAKKVEIPLVVRNSFPPGTDEIVEINGQKYRNLSPDKVGNASIDTDLNYVGLPPSVSALPSGYNLNPTPGQTSFNPHVSYLNEIYKASRGPLLKARLVSAAEVYFILAEAALKGWNVGNAKTHYEAAILASLNTWQLGNSYATYITQPGVAYAGTLQQIISQKWIASWTAATEAWFDYRRTGFPVLKAGPAAKREALPLRFVYMMNEMTINKANAEEAVNKLEVTVYSQAGGKNSQWSKPWLIKGTGKPW